MVRTTNPSVFFPFRKGLRYHRGLIVDQNNRPRVRMLHKTETARIHETVLSILRDVGVSVQDDETRKWLKGNGCKEGEGGFLTFDENRIEQALSTVPSKLVLYDRENRGAVDTEDAVPRFGSGLGCLNTLDFETGIHRPCLLEDVRKTARVCERLPNINLVLSLGSPSDVPPQEEALETVRALVENTSKPIAFAAHDEVKSDQVWEFLAQVAGGWEALSSKPFALELTGPTSPLRLGGEACRRLRQAARRLLPVVCFPGAIPGATAPMTLIGSLAQFAAETLAGIVIHQMEQPGAPVISGGGILPMDMRTGSLSYGGPEYTWICLATVDYLSDLGMPSWSGSGCSDAHTVDAQAASEAGMNLLASALTGTSLTHNLGYLSAGKTGSLEMLVLCDELAGMVRRIVAGSRVTEDTLAFHVVQQAGKTGDYMASDHTLKHVRSEMWVPSLFQRSPLSAWMDSGAKMMNERIREKLLTLLSE